MPGRTPFAQLLEARSAVALDLRDDGAEVLVASNLSGLLQLYRVPIEGGALIPVTQLNQRVTAGRYVPRSKRIVLSIDAGGDERHQMYIVDASGADAPGDPRPLVVDPRHLHVLGGVSRDGRMLSYSTNRRNGTDFDVVVRSLTDGTERVVVEGGGSQFPSSFSPDGRLLCVLRDNAEAAMDADLLVVAVDGGDVRHITPHEGAATAAAPTWYPDSRRILFSWNAHGEFMSLYRHDLDSGATEQVLGAQSDAFAALSADGERAVVGVNMGGRTRLGVHRGDTLAPVTEITLPSAGVAVDSAITPLPRISADGSQVVLTFTAPGAPADVWLHNRTGSLARLTHSPGDIPAALTALDAEEHRVRNADGVEIPTFLYRPPVPAAEPVPTVLLIHGGPEAQHVPTFDPVILHLVDAGLAVVAPNVRGSTGYGRTYGHLDDGRRRLDSVGDLAAIHRWLPSAGLDPARSALMGGSYGGYMTLAGLAFQPDLWRAGVAIVGISSLVTFLENTSPYRRAVREREYGSLEHDRDFLVAASPLTHVDRMRAPLLLVHGANDPRVPVGEARQLHAQLRERGVTCELIVYDDEGHGLARLPNRLDAYPRMSAWLEQHLLGDVAGTLRGEAPLRGDRV